MIKAMLFIDGSWLYANLPELGKIYGKPDFQVDFGKLPTVLAEDIAEQAGIGAIDLVRTYYFASYAENYDARDVAAVQRRMAFFSRLKEDYNYEVEAFPINYQGRRLRRVDRDPADDFVPKEKCVDISLAITVMHYATVPGAMDVAILLIGDRDFVPLLQDIRRRGIRVALATIYGSCAQELADPADTARVRDFDTIWLNDLLDKIEYLGDDQAASQPGARRVWTTNVPRWGRRPSHWMAHRDELMRTAEGCAHEGEPGLGEILHGRIKNIIWDRGFGFIASESGLDYFFHANALEEGLTFEDLQPEMEVVFEVKNRPTPLRAGAALTVRRVTGATEARAEEPAAATPNAADAGHEAPPAVAMDGDSEGGRNGLACADAAKGPVQAVLADEARAVGLGGVLRGRIKNVIWDRGFGFIASDSGPDYFFHANGLVDLTFESLEPGLAVVFEVRTRPTTLRAGAALNVRRDLGAVSDGPPAAGEADADAAEADAEPADEGEEPGSRPAAAETLDLSVVNVAPERS